MKKLVMTLEIKDDQDSQEVFTAGVNLATLMAGRNKALFEPYIGVEVRDEPKTHSVEVG